MNIVHLVVGTVLLTGGPALPGWMPKDLLNAAAYEPVVNYSPSLGAVTRRADGVRIEAMAKRRKEAVDPASHPILSAAPVPEESWSGVPVGDQAIFVFTKDHIQINAQTPWETVDVRLQERREPIGSGPRTVAVVRPEALRVADRLWLEDLAREVIATLAGDRLAPGPAAPNVYGRFPGLDLEKWARAQKAKVEYQPRGVARLKVKNAEWTLRLGSRLVDDGNREFRLPDVVGIKNGRWIVPKAKSVPWS